MKLVSAILPLTKSIVCPSFFKQESPQERPAETAVDIHVQGKTGECPNSTETVSESVEPLGPNIDRENYTNGSAAEDISTSPLLEDDDAVSKTLLSHGEREPETCPKESRHDSAEQMEGSPLLQENMAKSVPHSESNSLI